MKKVLWKIESLWEQYYISKVTKPNYVADLYSDGRSLVNDDFVYLEKFDYSSSGRICFSDELGEYKGLLNSQLIYRNKVVYLFDNHNKILQPFLEYFESKKSSFDVVHIDAHADDAIFTGEKPKSLRLGDVVAYIKKTRISDFFDFLSLDNIISEIHRYIRSEDFGGFVLPKRPYILSLDIDIFGPEGNFIDLEEKVKLIAKAWASAEIVCISTSPGFIDQDFAFEIIKIFTRK